MQVVYAPEKAPETYSKSLFLAGPSPRESGQLNWRPEALKILENLGYDGVVYIPLPRNGQFKHSYSDQIQWEQTNLDRADQIVFWVPRDLENMLGLTTNFEFGKYFDSGRAILGYPPDAAKMRYLDALGKTEEVPIFNSLEETLAEAIRRIGPGAKRTGGELDVPLNIWNLAQFQNWYASQTAAGNQLDSAKVLWTFRVGKNKQITFCYALHVNVYIASENRNKTNEFIFSRPDLATIVAYCKPELKIARRTSQEIDQKKNSLSYLLDTQVALIREFRSPARTNDGMIHEVPGGSSWKPGTDPLVTMVHELEEETGLTGISTDRIRKIGSRQLCGTLCTHQAHTFACELTELEMDFLRMQQLDGTVHGVEADTERTYVEIHKLVDLLEEGSNLVDWSMLGQIFTAILTEQE